MIFKMDLIERRLNFSGKDEKSRVLKVVNLLLLLFCVSRLPLLVLVLVLVLLLL